MVKLNIKKQDGFTGVDAMIAILIVLAFTSLITTIGYHIYLNLEAIKRNANATSYAISIMEKVDSLYYDDVTEENLKLKDIPEGYIIKTTIEDYNEENLVKTVTVDVTYTLNKKEQVISMKKIKAREVLITPNIPELQENMIPVKYIKSENQTYWKITDSKDSTWYNYENGIWAAAINKNQDGIQIEESTGKIIGTPSIYYWIPKYAYKNTDIKFLYGTTNNYVEKQENTIGKLKNIDNDYSIYNSFNDDKGIWLLQNSEEEIYQALNKSIYKKQN